MSERSCRLALGVDGGGTKTDAVLVDDAGNVLGMGRGGSAHGLFVGPETVRNSYADAIRGALGNRRPQKLWVTRVPARVFERMGIEIAELHVVVCDELSMGLAMALETHGLVALSGTGSFVAGLTESGKSVYLDGLGPVLGDYGSAYQIGLTGMRAAAASSWSSERRTVLAQLIPRHFGVVHPSEVFEMVYTRHMDRLRIASAAKAVIGAAESGDAVAGRIVLQAADDISDVLADLVHELGIEDRDYALVASGGVVQNCDMYWERICERALDIAPRLRPIRPRILPCVGAALLALRAMGVPWSRELLSRIEETQRPYLAKIESSQPSAASR